MDGDTNGTKCRCDSTMINDKTLVCTACDSIVTAATGYDGYHGRCRCKTFYFQVGSGDPPYCWESWSDASSLSKFHVRLEGHMHGNETIEDDHVVCRKCNDGENVEFDVEEVDFPDADLKVAFRCLADHYFNDREIEEVAFFSSQSSGGSALLRLNNGT